MHRIFGIAVALYLLGDPELRMVSSMVGNSQLVLAVVITLLLAPWLRAQFDH